MKHKPLSFFRPGFVLLFLLFAVSGMLRAGQCTAIANGNWSSAATWSCGRAPANNDTMTIPAGFTVTVDINSPVYSNMLINVNGILDFGNGQKINMCPGKVVVSAAGQLSGGTPGSKINICGTTVWNGPGPTGGPLTYGDLPLPVELVSFTGTPDGNTVRLDWRTASELNNHYFLVERSTNGLSFEELGRVDGNGTTSQPHSYTLTDNQPVTGTCYYRLTQVDFNGQSETFPLIAVDFKSNTGDCVLSVNPNPCEGECTVSFSDCPGDNDGVIVLEMIDASGQTVSSGIPERNAKGGFTTVIDSRNNLKPGVYIVRGSSSKTAYQKKAVLK